MKRKLKKLLKQSLISYMIAAVAVLTAVPIDVKAMFLPSSVNLTQEDLLPNRQQNLEKLQRLLESKLISQRLSDLGFSQEEIPPRLNDLSDQQVQFFASHLDSLQTGGSLPGWLSIGAGYGVIYLAILIGLLVLALIAVMIAGVSSEEQDHQVKTDSDPMEPSLLAGGAK